MAAGSREPEPAPGSLRAGAGSWLPWSPASGGTSAQGKTSSLAAGLGLNSDRVPSVASFGYSRLRRLYSTKETIRPERCSPFVGSLAPRAGHETIYVLLRPTPRADGKRAHFSSAPPCRCAKMPVRPLPQRMSHRTRVRSGCRDASRRDNSSARSETRDGPGAARASRWRWQQHRITTAIASCST
jgi:hypothetical protein